MGIIKNFKAFNEKYEHTTEDKEQDIVLAKEFAEKFEDKFKTKLNLTDYTGVKFRDYLGYGAEKIYRTKLDIENSEFDSINKFGMVWISTGINPSGVKKEGEYHRTFTIHFELKGKKSQEIDGEIYTDEAVVKKFYSYSAEMDDIIEKFEEYVENEIR